MDIAGELRVSRPTVSVALKALGKKIARESYEALKRLLYEILWERRRMVMVWERTVLDGIAVCAVFNVMVALLWLLMPNAFSKMLPPEIRKAAPKREKKELVRLAGVLYPMYILIFVYMAVSARQEWKVSGT